MIIQKLTSLRAEAKWCIDNKNWIADPTDIFKLCDALELALEQRDAWMPIDEKEERKFYNKAIEKKLGL